MLSKRTFSPVKSSPGQEGDIDSPFAKQAKINNVDGPGKSYFEFINNGPKEEEKDDEKDSEDESESQPNRDEDFSEAFNRARNSLLNFLQMTQKVKEKNFLSQKELKTKFRVNFSSFPNTDEILKIFNKILKRVTLAKTQKRNWYQEDIVLLLWVVRRYCCFKNKHPDNLVEEDWLTIGEMIPVKSIDQCKFKFLTLKKVDLYKYPWTKDEDRHLKQIVNEKCSTKIKWGDVAKTLNQLTNSSIFRSGKLCRERWNNYLNPELKKSEWTSEEDCELLRLVLTVGKKWSEISKSVPGRNENSVKNRFFSLLRKERKKQNLGKSGDTSSFEETYTNSEEIGLINAILSDKSPGGKKENESLQEIKLKNLTTSLDNIKLNTISRIKKEPKEESKSTNPIPAPQNYPEHSKPKPQETLPQSASNIPTNQNPFLPPSFGSNPFLTDPKSGNYISNIIFQNIPKFIQMNSFGMFNPYFQNQAQSQLPPSYDSFKFPPFSPHYPEHPNSDPEKIDSVILNHPLFQSQHKVEHPVYSQTPHTLKNNLDLKRDPPSFSSHPLVEKTNEKPDNFINNSLESFPNFDCCMNPHQLSNISQPLASVFPSSQKTMLEPPQGSSDLTMKLKIRNGLELSPGDYTNCVYSVVNLSKRELFLFTPLSNPSESNKSFLSAFFNLGPSPNSSPQDDYISFNSGKSGTKQEANSFSNARKHKTFNSFVSSLQSSNGISSQSKINNTCLSNSPPHSPKKDSKFKENHCFPMNEMNE